MIESPILRNFELAFSILIHCAVITVVAPGLRDKNAHFCLNYGLCRIICSSYWGYSWTGPRSLQMFNLEIYFNWHFDSNFDVWLLFMNLQWHCINNTQKNYNSENDHKRSYEDEINDVQLKQADNKKTRNASRWHASGKNFRWKMFWPKILTTLKEKI